MKQCTICKVEKDLVEFHRNKQRNDGHDPRCKSCRHKHAILIRDKTTEYHKKHYILHKDRIDKKNKEYRHNNPDKSRNQKLVYSYGITLEQWNQMYTDQNGKCDICLSPLGKENTKNIHTDHNHNTGKVRGLLCKKCNSMIGLAREQKTILLNAISYLDKHKEI